jgi:hypothetical protein
MELAILFVPRHRALRVPEERDGLAGDGGELIHSRGTQLVLGFIQNGEKLAAIYYVKRMARRIGVGANVV